MSASLLFLFLGLASSYLLIRPLATWVHECGHVLALRLTGLRGELRVYLGSLGEGKGVWRMRFGGVVWLFHPRAFLMRGSLTDYDRVLGPPAWPWVALGGPLASLSLAGATTTIALVEWSGGPASLVLLLAGVLAGIDTALSLLYRWPPIALSNERVTGNDGQMLGWWWRYRRDLDAYLHARWLFEKDRYAETILAIEALMAAGHQEKLLFEYLMYAQLMVRQPKSAILLFEKLERLHSLDAYDHSLHALALEYLGDADAVARALEAAIAKAPGHPEALNHRAFLALQAGNIDAAHADLNRALRSNPEFAAALCNRAAVFLARLEPGKARLDLALALRLDHENPYVHSRWELLLAMEGEYEAALAAGWRARLLGVGGD